MKGELLFFFRFQVIPFGQVMASERKNRLRIHSAKRAQPVGTFVYEKTLLKTVDLRSTEKLVYLIERSEM